ncbi:MAG: YfjI family protein, partial [Actinomycetia bacterium]|nr:YfjI family protein [Actinomycetes bacterium]
MNDAATFFEALFGGVDSGYVSISAKPVGKKWRDDVEVVDLSKPDEITAVTDRLAKSEPIADVYATVCPRLTSARGRQNNTKYVTVLWLELDSTGSSDGKKGHPDRYFASLDEARQFVENSAPWRPALIVNSGHGWHFYWRLAEPVAEDLDVLLAAWRGFWEAKAKSAGKSIDPVFDSARVMRIPGTWNMKNLAVPVRVTVEHVDTAARYDASDILDVIPPEQRRQASTFVSALADNTEVQAWLAARSNGWTEKGRRYVGGLVDEMETAAERHPTANRLVASLLQSNRKSIDFAEAVGMLSSAFNRRVAGEGRESEFDSLVMWIVSQRIAEGNELPDSTVEEPDDGVRGPDNGPPVVAVDDGDEDEDLIAYRLPDGRELWLEDDGTGIPPQLDDRVYHGPIGGILRFWEGKTEPLTPTIAIELIARISACVGSGVYYLMPDGGRLGLNWWGLLIGDTSLSRKGTAAGVAKRSMPPDFDVRTTNGIGSGEKLIELVSNVEYDDDGKVTSGHMDQRLLIDEPEFGAILVRSEQSGSTLSPFMRKLYDGVPVHHEVKAGSTHASGYHLAIAASITPSELRNKLSDEAISNGFANRFQMFAGLDSIDL